MASPSKHRITAEISESLKIDITYSYRPEWPSAATDPGAAAEMEVITAVVVGNDMPNDWTPVYVRDVAQNWLDDEGYDEAVQHAEDERHGNEE
jgi:hypothetical protein